MRGQRRLGADDAAAAFQAFQQRGLFATDIRAGADPNLEIEAMCRAADAPAKEARALGGHDGRVHRFDGVRIFRADVNVAFGGADGDARNGHAFDHDEGIAFHDHAVGERAAVAFVGIADDVFSIGAGLRHGLPFDAGGKSRAAAAAQSRRR